MNKRATEFEKWLRLTEQAKSNKAEVIGKGISKLNIPGETEADFYKLDTEEAAKEKIAFYRQQPNWQEVNKAVSNGLFLAVLNHYSEFMKEREFVTKAQAQFEKWLRDNDLAKSNKADVITKGIYKLNIPNETASKFFALPTSDLIENKIAFYKQQPQWDEVNKSMSNGLFQAVLNHYLTYKRS
ncbi:hypothetical protein [Enterococcus sp. SMC-9]|uniref:hypothetical protein n=1 Tax=Enterococcus sp. SMC-9 TaxID=2862343 RepID=UPI001E48EACF|nr:hypothetical protein [Enterococcus sp. SMC-9]MCD1025468.1 hypothetical protein [Enterococcus sp. SMC-9]